MKDHDRQGQEHSQDDYLTHDLKHGDAVDLDVSHDALVSFLKQHKPIAPPPRANFEQQLFAEINKYPLTTSHRYSGKQHWRWWAWFVTIPTAIAVFGGVHLGMHLFHGRSQGQYAQQPVNEAEQAAIESSLIRSWSMHEDVVALASDLTDESTRDVKILLYVPPVEYE
jgi:hypothetical protein